MSTDVRSFTFPLCAIGRAQAVITLRHLLGLSVNALVTDISKTAIFEPRHDKTNTISLDQSLRYPHEETLGP